MIGLGIISVPFCLVSLYFLLTYLHYKLYGKKVSAKVFAYEKLISRTSTSSNGTSSQLMYYPIFKYVFSGEEHLLKGAGRNYFPYKIGEYEEILMLHNNPKHVIADNIIYPLFGFIFGLFGFGAQVYFQLFSKVSLIEKVIPLALYLLIPILIYIFLKNKGLWNEVVNGHFNNSSIIEQKYLEGKDVFYSSKDITKEESRTYKAGLIIGILFLAGTIFGMNHAWEKMPKNIKDILLNFSWSELQPHIEHPMVVLFCFCAVMSLLLVYSSIRSLTKI